MIKLFLKSWQRNIFEKYFFFSFYVLWFIYLQILSHNAAFSLDIYSNKTNIAILKKNYYKKKAPRNEIISLRLICNDEEIFLYSTAKFFINNNKNNPYYFFSKFFPDFREKWHLLSSLASKWTSCEYLKGGIFIFYSTYYD